MYIAPDLLPERATVQMEVDSGWDVDLPTTTLTFEFELLHSGLMRGVIARIGNQAGIHAIYWHGGVYVYETNTHSRALIEQISLPNGWAGAVRLQTKGGSRVDLIERLASWITEESDQLGLRPKLDRSLPRSPIPEEGPLVFGPEAVTQPQYGVSYAWNDKTPGGYDREELVNRFCIDAERRGIHILRDHTDMRVGGRISEFMRRLALCDRVFVILSEKYLRSVYCMSELYWIWLQCKSDESNFITRVRVFTLPDTRISTISERAAHIAWWKDEHARIRALVKAHGADFLSPSDYAEFRRMGDFVRHVPEILSTLQDTLRPRSFDDFITYGLVDPPSNS